SCRTALLKLADLGWIRLPIAGEFPAARKRPQRTMETDERLVQIQTRLAKLQPIELVQIGSGARGLSKEWNDLMDRYHPLGAGPLCGAQIRYLIRSAKQEWLGGLAFSAAAWRLRDRDQWIGWEETAREQNLYRVANNSRFLILPYVRVAHLASHVLGLVV